MIVSCPACESRFEVDQAQLGPDGRIVRCGKCSNCWHQMPEDDPRAALAEEPTPPPIRRRPAPPPRKRGYGTLIGWILLLLFVGGVAAGGWLERERIVAEFPQLRDVYALLGVPVEPPGPIFKLGEVKTERSEADGDTVIVVRGVVSNISDRKQSLPPLRVQLTDSAGAVVHEWSFEPPQKELDAGGVVAFESQTRNPPDTAQNLNISIEGDQQ